MTLAAPDGPPVRRVQEVPVREVMYLASGQYILDFGQNFVGRIRVTVDGPPGTVITFQHAEVLEDGVCATRPLRGAKAKDIPILSGQGMVEWEPSFTFHGFRYVQIAGWPGKLDAADVYGVVLHTDMIRTGHFKCSNPALNKLHENVVWSMRGNFVSIPTDCPQRDERLGWTGDVNMFANTANFLYDTTRMLSSWLKDLSKEQRNGIVPLTIPNVVEGLGDEAHALWGDVVVMLPWSLYEFTGDVELLSSHYTSMLKWLDAIPRRSNGMWNYTSAWKLGDWLDPEATPDDPGIGRTDPNFVSDAFLVHVTELVHRISSILGRDEEALKFRKQAAQLRGVFAFKYSTGYTLALHYGLLSGEVQRQTATARLEYLVKRNSRFKIATGFAGTPIIGHAMTKVGLTGLFYRMLLHRKCPSWLYPVTMGATTIWERWGSTLPDGRISPGEMTSFNHYELGSVAEWMHCTIAGLKPMEPGWNTFRIKPEPGGGLKWASAQYQSPYGRCVSEWEIVKSNGGNELLRLRVTIPPDATAFVKAPPWEKPTECGSGVHEWLVNYKPESWPPRALYPPFMERDDNLPEEDHLPFQGTAL